jgi:hypothetical protein
LPDAAAKEPSSLPAAEPALRPKKVQLDPNAGLNSDLQRILEEAAIQSATPKRQKVSRKVVQSPPKRTEPSPASKKKGQIAPKASSSSSLTPSLRPRNPKDL